MPLQSGLLDEIAKAACWACQEKVDKSQVNKLLEVLESTGSIDYVMVFIARQHGRREIRRNTSRTLINILSRLGSINESREALGIFKWLYEACTGRRLPHCDQTNLRQLINYCV